MAEAGPVQAPPRNLPRKPCNCGSGKLIGQCEGPGCAERAAALAASRSGSKPWRWGRILAKVVERKGKDGRELVTQDVVDFRRPATTPKHLRTKKPRPGSSR